MELGLLMASAIIFIGYLLFIGKTYGVQKSISASYYSLPKKWNFVFTLVLWSFALPILIVSDEVLMVIAASGIMFVGAASAFDRKQAGKEDESKFNKFKDWTITKKVHMVGAFGGIIVGMLSVIFDYHLLIFVAVVSIFSVFLKFYVKNHVWWIEVVAFITIWLTIFASLTV